MKKNANSVLVNERGLRVGQSHPNAVLTDHDVDLLLELRAEGFSYGWLARKFEIHRQTVAKICQGLRRGQPGFVRCTRGRRAKR